MLGHEGDHRPYRYCTRHSHLTIVDRQQHLLTMTLTTRPQKYTIEEPLLDLHMTLGEGG